MHFFLPTRLEWPRFAVLSLRQGRIAFQLLDEHIIRMGLLPSKINIESKQRDHRDDRHVVSRGENFPQLFPIHGYRFSSLTSESSTTSAGPEMPPSLRTRQKCRIMKIEATMGMPMQCHM